jgi:cysteine desulfurase/selenocysteine lyase
MKLMTTNTKRDATTLSGVTCRLDHARIRLDFPILEQEVNGYPLVYLDNAATSQKPKVVIEAIRDYYRRQNANIHRGLHFLAERATAAYEQTRRHVAQFIGGVAPEEVIFTRGTTEAINLIAYAWGETNIREGDEIVITEMEHHANLVPWVVLTQKKRATLRRIPITLCGHLDLSHIDDIITERTKLVCVTHMSNVLGTINPIADLAKKAHAVGALFLADGAQSTPHLPVNVKELGVDFYAFSSHKMLGPTGVGILYGRKEILESMPPFNMGGEMIDQVYFDRVTWAEIPHKFEAGTPNIADVVAFDAALTYLENLGMDRIREHEEYLTGYALRRLAEIKGLEIQGPQEASGRGGAISFTDPHLHPHDISTFLDSRGIAIRAGHHCAQPLLRTMGKLATARASLYIYNDESEIDRLVQALIDMRRYFGV